MSKYSDKYWESTYNIFVYGKKISKNTFEVNSR